jgi:DNA-binding transcriptional MerR regulator
MAGKSPDAFRTISEVADWLDRPAHVLRFWESKFTQVKPVKRAGGRRYYRPDDMLLLGGIKKLLHDDGMTIKGVQKVLRDQGVRYVSGLSQPLDEEALHPALEGVADVVADGMEEARAGGADAADVAPAETADVTARLEWPAAADMDKAADPQTETVAAAPAPADPAPAAAPDPAPAAAPDASPDPAPDASPARAPLGADLPLLPDLAAIPAEPGLLSAIAARRLPLSAAERAALAPILARLEDLGARMATARKA